MAVPHSLRWPVIVVGGVILAVGSGLLAAWVQTGGWDTLVFVAFGVCMLVPYSSVLYTLVSPTQHQRVPEHEGENVENAWMKDALAGTTIDLFIVLGVLTAFASIFGVDEPGVGAALVFLMGDVAVRYLTLRRNEA